MKLKRNRKLYFSKPESRHSVFQARNQQGKKGAALHTGINKILVADTLLFKNMT
jgi:hypothetical protein